MLTLRLESDSLLANEAADYEQFGYIGWQTFTWRQHSESISDGMQTMAYRQTMYSL